MFAILGNLIFVISMAMIVGINIVSLVGDTDVSQDWHNLALVLAVAGLSLYKANRDPRE